MNTSEPTLDATTRNRKTSFTLLYYPLTYAILGLPGPSAAVSPRRDDDAPNTHRRSTLSSKHAH